MRDADQVTMGLGLRGFSIHERVASRASARGRESKFGRFIFIGQEDQPHAKVAKGQSSVTQIYYKHYLLSYRDQTNILRHMKQQSFFKKVKDCFGGSLLKSNPKTKRPLDSKLPIHLVLKATTNEFRKAKNFATTNDLLDKVAEKHGVRIYEQAVHNDHIHLLIKIPKRSRWSGYIRELTGKLAQQLKIKWKHRPFTRVIKGWRKAFATVRQYIEMNHLEAEGNIDYHDREILKFLRERFAAYS